MKKLLLLALFIPAIILDQEQQSETFRILSSVIATSGGGASSEDFGLMSTLGQPTPAGLQSSASFRHSAGFLTPDFAVSPLSPIQTLVIASRRPTILLVWNPVAGANSYKIYRDITATFTPGPLNYLNAVSDTSYTDATALGLLSPVYFYSVSASRDALGNVVRSPDIPFLRKEHFRGHRITK